MMKTTIYLAALSMLMLASHAYASEQSDDMTAQANLKAQQELQRKIRDIDLPDQNAKLMAIFQAVENTIPDIAISAEDQARLAKYEKFSTAFAKAKKVCEASPPDHKQCNVLLRLANDVLPVTGSAEKMSTPQTARKSSVPSQPPAKTAKIPFFKRK